MSYKERLDAMVEESFPTNPCKFMKIWKADGKKAYDSMMDDAVFLKDDDDRLYQAKDVAAALSAEHGVQFSDMDVWKHRHNKCVGCATKAGITV